jgi:hypothetical protein
MSKRLMTGLYWFLALEFALGAVTKYWPGDTIFSSAYSAKFVDWGYPSWMRFVVGAPSNGSTMSARYTAPPAGAASPRITRCKSKRPDLPMSVATRGRTCE